MGKCPVCGKQLVLGYRDTMDGWCLMEEEYKCKEGHYVYFYATGTTEISIDGKPVLVYWYDKEPTRLEKIFYRIALARAKIFYKLKKLRP